MGSKPVDYSAIADTLAAQQGSGPEVKDVDYSAIADTLSAKGGTGPDIKEIDYSAIADTLSTGQAPNTQETLKIPETFLGMKLPKPDPSTASWSFDTEQFQSITHVADDQADIKLLKELAKTNSKLRWAGEPYTNPNTGEKYPTPIDYVFTFDPATNKEAYQRLEILYDKEQAIKQGVSPLEYAMGQAKYVFSPMGAISVVDVIAQAFKGLVTLPIVALQAKGTYSSTKPEIHVALHKALSGDATSLMTDVGGIVGQMEPNINMMQGAGPGYILEEKAGPAPVPSAEQWNEDVQDYHKYLSEKYQAPLTEVDKKVIGKMLHEVNYDQQWMTPEGGIDPTPAGSLPRMAVLNNGEYQVDVGALYKNVDGLKKHMGYAGAVDTDKLARIISQELGGVSGVSDPTENMFDLLVHPYKKLYKDFTEMPEQVLRNPGMAVLMAVGPIRGGIKKVRGGIKNIQPKIKGLGKHIKATKVVGGKKGVGPLVAATLPDALTVPPTVGFLSIAASKIVRALQSKPMDKALAFLQNHTVAYLNPIYTWKQLIKLAFGKTGKYVKGIEIQGPLAPLRKTRTGQLFKQYITGITAWMMQRGFGSMVSIVSEASAEAVAKRQMVMKGANNFFRHLEQEWSKLHPHDGPLFKGETFVQSLSALLDDVIEIGRKDKQGKKYTPREKFLKKEMMDWSKQFRAMEFGFTVNEKIKAALKDETGLAFTELMIKEAANYGDYAGKQLLSEVAEGIKLAERELAKEYWPRFEKIIKSNDFQKKAITNAIKEDLSVYGNKQAKLSAEMLNGGEASIQQMGNAQAAIIPHLKKAFNADDVAAVRAGLEKIATKPPDMTKMSKADQMKITMGLPPSKPLLKSPSELIASYTAGTLVDIISAKSPAEYAVAINKATNGYLVRDIRAGIIKYFADAAHATGRKGAYDKLTALLVELEHVYKDTSKGKSMLGKKGGPELGYTMKDIGAHQTPGMYEQWFKYKPADAKRIIAKASDLLDKIADSGIEMMKKADQINEGALAARWYVGGKQATKNVKATMDKMVRPKSRKTATQLEKLMLELLDQGANLTDKELLALAEGTMSAKQVSALTKRVMKEAKHSTEIKGLASSIAFATVVEKAIARTEIVQKALMGQLDTLPEAMALAAKDPTYKGLTEPLFLSDYILAVYQSDTFSLHDTVMPYLESLNANIADTPATIAMRRKAKGPVGPKDPFGEMRAMPAPLDFLEGTSKNMSFGDFEAIVLPMKQAQTWVANDAFKRGLLSDVFIKNLGKYLPDVNRKYHDAIAEVFAEMGPNITGGLKSKRVLHSKGEVAPRNRLEDLFLEYMHGSLSLINDVARYDIAKALKETVPHAVYDLVEVKGEKSKLTEGGSILEFDTVGLIDAAGNKKQLHEYHATKFSTKYENFLHKHGQYMTANEGRSRKLWYQDPDTGNMYVKVPDVDIRTIWKKRAGEKIESTIKKFGDLTGTVVPMEVFDYLNGTANVFEGALASFTGGKILGTWKKAKVVWEPKAHFRNFITNLMVGGVAGYITDLRSAASTIMSCLNKQTRNKDGSLTPYGMMMHTGVIVDGFATAEAASKAANLMGLDPIVKMYAKMPEKGLTKVAGKIAEKLQLRKMEGAYAMSEAMFKGWHMEYLGKRLELLQDMYKQAKPKEPFRTWAKKQSIPGGHNELALAWNRGGRLEGDFGKFIDSLYGVDKGTGFPRQLTAANVFKRHAETFLLNYGDMSPLVNTIRSVPSLFLGNAFISFNMGMLETFNLWSKRNPARAAVMSSMANSMDQYTTYSDMVAPIWRTLMFLQKGDSFNSTIPLKETTVMYNGEEHRALDVLKTAFYSFTGAGARGLENISNPESDAFLSINMNPMEAPLTKIMSWISDKEKDTLRGKQGLVSKIWETLVPSWFYGGHYMNQFIKRRGGYSKHNKATRSAWDIFAAMVLGWKTDKLFLHKTVDNLNYDFRRAMELQRKIYKDEIKSILVSPGLSKEQVRVDMIQAEVDLAKKVLPILWLYNINRFFMDKNLYGADKTKIIRTLNAQKSKWQQTTQ